MAGLRSCRWLRLQFLSRPTEPWRLGDRPWVGVDDRERNVEDAMLPVTAYRLELVTDGGWSNVLKNGHYGVCHRRPLRDVWPGR